ncbi:unnamed protein product [Gongylonema pulchrum]|uniref:V-type proton ATPase subunit a n=1 Tax=Gongylonema pulchrum TaxID=637853 RepID=A0A183DXA5_9BILA|nr:unnamed protein product [Gongylonema pulchrum]
MRTRRQHKRPVSTGPDLFDQYNGFTVNTLCFDAVLPKYKEVILLVSSSAFPCIRLLALFIFVNFRKELENPYGEIGATAADGFAGPVVVSRNKAGSSRDHCGSRLSHPNMGDSNATAHHFPVSLARSSATNRALPNLVRSCIILLFFIDSVDVRKFHSVVRERENYLDLEKNFKEIFGQSRLQLEIANRKAAD